MCKYTQYLHSCLVESIALLQLLLLVLPKILEKPLKVCAAEIHRQLAKEDFIKDIKYDFQSTYKILFQLTILR